MAVQWLHMSLSALSLAMHSYLHLGEKRNSHWLSMLHKTPDVGMVLSLLQILDAAPDVNACPCRRVSQVDQSQTTEVFRCGFVPQPLC